MRTTTRAGSLAAIVAATALLLPVGAGATELSPGARPPAPEAAATAEAGQDVQAEVTELTAGGPALVPGTWLVSANGRYRLGIDADGYLVVQERGNWLDPDGHTWYLPDTNYGAVDRLVLQTDSNLVGYGPTGVVVNYRTQSTGATVLRLGDDKQMRLFDSAGSPVGTRRTNGDLYLERGDFLLPGESMTGERGLTRVVMQTDGNFVLYRGSTPLWSTRTGGNPGAGVVMQADGNLVVYSSAATGRKALFSTRTFGYDEPEVFPYLRIEDTEVSVVVQYDGGSEAVWGSNWGSSRLAPGDELNVGDRRRSPDGRCVLVMQGDVNLVQYCDGRPLFRTGAKPAYSYDIYGTQTTRMQGDGNLVVYGTSGDERPVPVYFTGTRTPGSSLAVQNDRNLVLRAPDGSPVWSSFTGRLR